MEVYPPTLPKPVRARQAVMLEVCSTSVFAATTAGVGEGQTVSAPRTRFPCGMKHRTGLAERSDREELPDMKRCCGRFGLRDIRTWSWVNGTSSR